MSVAPTPDNEHERLAALAGFDVLDTLPQQLFDDITRLASTICGTPIALISLVDKERQWFKSRVGLDVQQTSREVAFCAHAILDPGQVMVVEDATRDQRFRDNPLVLGAPDFRFYAGAPIVTTDGFALGTVCVIDREKRALSPAQAEALRALSRMVVALLEHDKNLRDESRRLTDRARRTIEYLQAIDAESLDLMAFVDRDHAYRYVNQTFLDYYSLRREDVVGRGIAEVLGERYYREVVKPLIDDAFAGRATAHERLYDYPGRGPTHVELQYLPARDADGEIVGVVVRAHNIEALKQRESQLKSVVAMLEARTLEQQKFIHIVSHDLREPINTIVNFSSLLADDHAADLPAPARRYLEFVRAGGKRMKALLDDLLSFVQLENYSIDARPVDLNAAMKLVRDDLALAISQAGAQVLWDELPVVAGDASQLRLVLQNLVTNGIKFARKDVAPVVRLSASVAGNQCQIMVQDNGIGIPDTQLENIFDMFKRLHSRTQYDGTGLGLSICRKIAELHGGRIAAASTPGQGSCFTLSLPIFSAPLKELSDAGD